VADDVFDGQWPVVRVLASAYLLADTHDRLDVRATLGQLLAEGVQISELDLHKRRC